MLKDFQTAIKYVTNKDLIPIQDVKEEYEVDFCTAYKD